MRTVLDPGMHDVPCCYMISNRMTAKRYIGQTTTPRKRIETWRASLRKDTVPQEMKEDLALYGPDSFLFEVLCYCTPENVELNETKLISALKPEYNVKKTDTKKFQPNPKVAEIKNWAIATLRAYESRTDQAAVNMRKAVHRRVDHFVKTGETKAPKERKPPKPMPLKLLDHPDGRKLTFREAAEECGVSLHTMRNRYYNKGHRGEKLFLANQRKASV